MEETISLKELFTTIKKRLPLIIIITLLVTVAAAVYSNVTAKPTYQASTQILINRTNAEEEEIYNNEIQTNIELISTYNVIIKSQPILDKVKDELGLQESASQLEGKISASSEKGSQVVSIDVTDDDKAQAADIANTVATIFQDEIKNIMKVDNVSILAKADPNENVATAGANTSMTIGLAFFISLMASLVLAFILEYLENTFKSEEEIEAKLNAQVLGTIPMIDRELKDGKVQTSYQTQAGGERIGS
jgi:capsular polysaccharide biosynthesis protein